MTSENPPLLAGTTRLFAERTAAAMLAVHLDRYGFLQPSSQFFRFGHLLERPCALVVAAPWIGKSFTARRIDQALASPPAYQPEAQLVRYHHRSDLETWIPGPLPVPSWWSDWRQADARAAWIIDALDEGERRAQGALCPALLDLLAALSREELQRLRLLIFARDGDLQEVAPEFESGLKEIFGRGFFVAQLLPLDTENAQDLVRAEHWDRILALIESNSLQAVAGYPAALQFLEHQPSAATLSIQDVWKGVLQQLLKEHHYHSQPFRTELERRFASSARIAAVLTLIGQEEIATSGGLFQLTVSQLFPVPELPYQAATHVAANEAIRSAMFQPTSEAYRFRHKNVREWMAAFGLACLPLGKLGPVLSAAPTSPSAPPSIRPELNDLAQILVRVHEDPAVQAWVQGGLRSMPSDLFAPSLHEVRRLLDRLEQLADRGARLDWLDDPESMRPFLVAGLDEEVSRRLAEDTKHPAARIMLVRIAAALDLERSLATASSIVPDLSQDEGLRSWCASALSRADRVDPLKALVPFVESAEPGTREECAIVSTLIAAFVTHGLWTAAQAFRRMPRAVDPRVIDATRTLPLVLKEHMSVEAAEEIVSDVDATEIEQLETDERYGWDSRRREPRAEAYTAAVEKLASVRPVAPARLRRLFPFALSVMVHQWLQRRLMNLLMEAFRASEVSRRELFLAAVEAQKVDPGRRLLWWWTHHLLGPEDLEWLEDRLLPLSDDLPEIWSVVFHLADRTNNEPVRQRVRIAVERNAPGVIAGYEKALEEQREQERQEQERQAQEEAGEKPIEEIDRQLLALPGLRAQQLLWQLSWVNFSADDSRPTNLVGSWLDVPAPLQRQVLDACTAALDSVAPTPIPQGSSYPRTVQYEAQAFIALRRLEPDRFELTAARIGRWLPAVLRSFHPQKNALLADCFHLHPGPTEHVLLEAIARELSEADAYSVLLQDLPVALWTDNVAHWVAAGIEGAQPAGSRPRLLELLAARKPEEGLRVSHSVLQESFVIQLLPAGADGSRQGRIDALGIQALDILLALDPEAVWPRFEEGAALAGERFLELLRGFGNNAREGLRVNWFTWPPDRLVRLTRVLFAAYPPENDPLEEGAGPVLPKHEFRQLCWRILEHLTRSPSAEASAAAEAVKSIHLKAREFVESLQASRAASDLLTAPLPSSQGITVVEVSRLLDDQFFRLIRSADDLLEVIMGELGELEKHVGYDHAMLYCPAAKRAAERHRREEALQAYVLRRLEDRLPGKVLDRETEVKLRGRLDIRVIAPVVITRELVKVVIEVKWSDNNDAQRGISTALSEQLGRRYLLGEGLHHGVFLVGWTGTLGTWKRTAGPRPRESPAALAEALRRQAEEFRRDHPNIDIRPVVWDLQPSPRTRRPSRSRSRRRSRSTH
ncbi:MAG TPA: hypothetical protein VN999_01370 [Thermoanaerobaculia bacterium]|nr:hypothetical protein [Thermoanaerobaculia bacterium]